MTKQSRTGRPPTGGHRWVGVAVATLLVLSLTSCESRDQEPRAIDTIGTPVLQLDRDYVDFGDVPFNQMIEATFEVTNTGDATLLFAETPFVELKDGC